jgi:uncharacterized protein (DUF1684 family)
MNDGILERLDRLEAENRRWRAAGSALLVALLGVVFLGQAAPASGAIEATSIVVRGPEGKGVLRLGAQADGTFGVALEDSAGKARAAIRFASKGEPELVVADSTGAPRVHVGEPLDEVFGMQLLGKTGQIRSWWRTHEDDPFLDFFDSAETTRIGLSYLSKSDSAGISLFNAQGATRAGLVSSKDDTTRFTMRTGATKNESKVLELFVRPNGEAAVQIVNPAESMFALFGAMPKGAFGTYVGSKDGKMRLALSASPDNSVLQLGDEAGKKLAELNVFPEKAVPVEKRAKTPPSSLILYDRSGNVSYQTPGPK